MQYDISTVTDWYWKKQDGALYSSAQQGEVGEDNPQYQQWLAAGGLPTPYPKDNDGNESRAELAKVLAPYGLRVYPPSPEEVSVMRQAEILARLAEIDAASVRPLRAIAQGEAIQADHDRLAVLDAEAASLRAELAALPTGD